MSQQAGLGDNQMPIQRPRAQKYKAQRYIKSHINACKGQLKRSICRYESTWTLLVCSREQWNPRQSSPSPPALAGNTFSQALVSAIHTHLRQAASPPPHTSHTERISLLGKFPLLVSSQYNGLGSGTGSIRWSGNV